MPGRDANSHPHTFVSENPGERIVIEGKGWGRAQGRVVGLGACHIHLHLETQAVYAPDGEETKIFHPGDVIEVSAGALAGPVDDTPPPRATVKPPEPSIGRIVHYETGGDNPPMAAIITEVIPADDTIEGSGDVTVVGLTVFTPDEGPQTVQNVPQATYAHERRTWAWPPRVA